MSYLRALPKVGAIMHLQNKLPLAQASSLVPIIAFLAQVPKPPGASVLTCASYH